MLAIAPHSRIARVIALATALATAAAPMSALAQGGIPLIRDAQTELILAMLLGAGALVAGAKTGGAGNGLTQAGAAAVQAPQEMIRRNLLSYQRQQEENADRAGVKYLNSIGQSPRGMYETFKR